jgi:hypothetical protein
MVLLGMVPVLMQTPPTHSPFFDQRDALARLRRLNRRPLSRRAGAEHDHVEALHAEGLAEYNADM